MKRIVVIGSGNLAEALAQAVARTPQLRLVQLYARNPQRGGEVARLAATEWCGDPAHLAEADLYLIAVSDRAVGEVAASLLFPPAAVVAHTAGCVPLDALPARIARRGVFYPLQTFTRGRAVDFSAIPLFIEAGDDETAAELEAVARLLSRRVLGADSALRERIHLAGVFVSNFANHMFALGERTMERAGLPVDLLRPLMAETAAKALDAPAAAAVQTGPAVRGDLQTQQRHLELLDDELQTLYTTISESIWQTSRKR